MVYRQPAQAPDDQRLDDEIEAARLDADLRDTRVRTRRLLQAAGGFSLFLYLKTEAFGWIPAGVVHFGHSVWAALLLASAVSLYDQWRTARELKKAMKPDG
jgi:hypothetical protein